MTSKKNLISNNESITGEKSDVSTSNLVEDAKEKILQRLLNNKPGIAEFSRFAFPIMRQSLPPLNGAGNHNFRGNTNIDEVNFEGLILDEYKDDYAKWYSSKMDELNIDSSIRKEVLNILHEAGLLPCHPANIHSESIVGVQPMTQTTKNHALKYKIIYSGNTKGKP